MAGEAVSAAYVQRHHEAVPAESCGGHSQAWKPAQLCPSRKTWGRQNLSPARDLFHPFCYTSKHEGTTLEATAADSEGSPNVLHLTTNSSLGRNTVLGRTALYDSMGKAEGVWKAGNQNTTSLSSNLGSVRNLLFL